MHESGSVGHPQQVEFIGTLAHGGLAEGCWVPEQGAAVGGHELHEAVAVNTVRQIHAATAILLPDVEQGSCRVVRQETGDEN